MSQRDRVLYHKMKMYPKSNPEVPSIDKGIKFQNFCQETSLHGWKFLYFKKFEACQAAVWTLAISSAISICGWLISTLVLGKLILVSPIFSHYYEIVWHISWYLNFLPGNVPLYYEM